MKLYSQYAQAFKAQRSFYRHVQIRNTHVYIKGQFPVYTDRVSITCPSTHLTFLSIIIELTQCPRMLHHITAYEAGAFELENPHTSPSSFPRQSHIVFLWCLQCQCSAEKQLITRSPQICNRSCHLCQQQETVQKPQEPSTEIVIRLLQCMQFKGLGSWYCSVNSPSHPCLYWNPIHSWQSIQANCINPYTSNLM